MNELDARVERLEVANAQLESDKAGISEKLMDWMQKFKILEQDEAETKRSLRMSRQTIDNMRKELEEANLFVGLNHRVAGFQVVHQEKGFMPAGLDDNDLLTTAAMVRVIETEEDAALHVIPVYSVDLPDNDNDQRIVLGPSDIYV
jgi:predicted nuclease with TOPRIM domain